MKKIIMIGIICCSQLFSMEIDNNNNNNNSKEIPFLSPKEVVELSEKLLSYKPAKYDDIIIWIQNHTELLQSMRMPEMDDHEKYHKHRFDIIKNLYKKKCNVISHDLLKFQPEGSSSYCCFAEPSNSFCSKASSLGIDSGPTKNVYDEVRTQGISIFHPKKDLLKRTTAKDAPPSHQHLSVVAYYLRLLQALNKSKKINMRPAFAVSYDDPSKFDDENYIVVQPANSKEHILLANEEKNPSFCNEFINKETLHDWETAVLNGAWNLNPNIVTVNTKHKSILIDHIQKPNNEGWGGNPGITPRWGSAIFSNEDEKSSHPWKWDHNIRFGYDNFERMLHLSSNSEELIEEWKQMKNEHAPKE